MLHLTRIPNALAQGVTHKPLQRWAALPMAVGMMALCWGSPVLAQEKLLRTLTVTGRGIEKVQTTLTQVRLGVEAQGKTANEVQAEVARRSNSVVTLLKSRGVENLETTGINLGPLYNYDNGKQTLVGYTASNLVSFRVGTAKAGGIMDEAVKAGASRIDGVSFMATDEALEMAQQAALRKATLDAQTQSKAVLSSLNLVPQEIVSIQVNGANVPQPRFYDMENLKLRASAMAAPTPVMGGEQQVDASVTLQIRY